MTPDLLFDIATRAVLPGWLALVFLPRWRWTARLVSVLIPALLGSLYLVLIVRSFGSGDGIERLHGLLENRVQLFQLLLH